MKKIIWIASYPKSGNTYIRCFLSHYIYNNKSKFTFDLLKKIPKFESSEVFNRVFEKNSFSEDFTHLKLFLEAQEKLIKKFDQKELIFKTHHFFGQLNNHHFTQQKTTLLFVYLVRDPREVLISYARHSNMTINEMLNFFTSDKVIRKYKMETIVNWSMHYKSWKSFKEVPSIFIKFEDLVKNPKIIFNSLIKFLSQYTNIQFDQKKIDETTKLTMFTKLQDLENRYGFVEAEEAKFFNSGKIDSWKKLLTQNQIKIIENKFYTEMKELNYLL